MDPISAPTNRNIPSAIKREVRQRCGFGCVICGTPLVEYDHLLGWAVVQRHKADEITLLCSRHHEERTKGLLPLDKVIQANALPVNLTQGVSQPYPLHFTGQTCHFYAGSNTFSCATTDSDFIAVMIDDICLLGFGFEDGNYLLYVNLFNKFNERVLQVEANQLVHSASLWDVEFKGRVFKVREGTGDVLCELLFEPPDRVTLTRGHFLYNGVEVFVRPNFLAIVNNNAILTHDTFIDYPVAMNIGASSEIPSGMRFKTVPRYGIDRQAQLAALIKKANELGQPADFD